MKLYTLTVVNGTPVLECGLAFVLTDGMFRLKQGILDSFALDRKYLEFDDAITHVIVHNGFIDRNAGMLRRFEKQLCDRCKPLQPSVAVVLIVSGKNTHDSCAMCVNEKHKPLCKGNKAGEVTCMFALIPLAGIILECGTSMFCLLARKDGTVSLFREIPLQS